MRNYNSAGLRLMTAPFNYYLSGGTSTGPYGSYRHIVLSLWTGSEFTDPEFDALAAASFTSIATGGYDGSLYSNHIKNVLGRTELARFFFVEFNKKRIIRDFNERLFSFSQDSTSALGLAEGTAECFTMSMTNDTTSNGYAPASGATANRVHPFILNGSVGDLNSSADLRMKTTAITVGQKIRMNDMTVKIGDALNVPLF